VSKRKSRKQSSSQRILWVLSLVLVGSMVLSLIIVALPGSPEPTPEPLPTWPWTQTPRPSPTPETPETSPTLTVAPPATATEPPVGPELPTATPTSEATEPPMGPELPTPTITPTVTPSPTITPTVTPSASFTPTGAGPALQFAVAGDSRDNPGVYRQVLAAVVADGNAFLLHTGDLVNKGTEAQWQEFEQIMAGFPLPFFPVPGNHDGLGGELDGYLASSGAPAAHYSFDRGPVHFVLADSHNGGIGAADLAWLREDLGSTAQPLKMVFLHHPPFDPDGTDHIMAYGNESFMDLMAEQGVDYVFAGHIHAYARGERDGVTYLITGGGGAPLYTQDHPQAFYHFLRVSVQDEDVTIEVVRV
jgi:predicted phosphodiesterase